MTSRYTAPNDYRAFCEMLGETEYSMSHHGVKGMHWGERKYQNPDGSLTEAGRKHYGYGEARKKKAEKEDASDKKAEEIEKAYSYDKTYTINDKLVKEAIKNAKEWDKNRTYDLHAGEKQAKKDMWSTVPISFVLGASAGAYVSGLNPVVTAAGSIASGTVHAGVVAGLQARASIANHKLKKTIDEISANTNVDKKTGLKLKNTEMNYDQDMEMVNPGYKNLSDNTKNNCLICSATFALRRHGYDVTANGANDGYDRTAILQAFPKAKMNFYKLNRIPFSKEGRQKIIDTIGIPEGGYGYLGVRWQMGGGHALIYSVESGKPVIRDCQTNKTYRGSSINKILQNTSGESTVIRLDNVQPDIKQMKKMGLINPAGQNFKPEQKANTEKAAETATTSGKHGYTGALYREAQRIFHPLRDEQEIYARDRTRTEGKENQKKNKHAYKNSEEKFDGKEFGLEKPIVRTSAYNLGEAKDSEHASGNRAMYKTYYTNKNSSYVKLSFDADAESKGSNRASVKQRVNDAKHVAEDEKRIVQQIPNKLQSSAIKKEWEKNYGYTQKDWNEICKSLYVNEVILGEPDSKGRVRGLVNLGTDPGVNRFGSTHFDCSFVTLPNGKVIILDADPTSND